MKHNPKAKGIAFEREVKKDLLAKGMFVVRQAASFFPDLVAISRDGNVTFVECKLHGQITKAEQHKLWKLAFLYSTEACIAYKKLGAIVYKQLR